jgi:hypothetical protein
VIGAVILSAPFAVAVAPPHWPSRQSEGSAALQVVALDHDPSRRLLAQRSAGAMGGPGAWVVGWRLGLFGCFALPRR